MWIGCERNEFFSENKYSLDLNSLRITYFTSLKGLSGGIGEVAVSVKHSFFTGFGLGSVLRVGCFARSSSNISRANPLSS